MKHWRTYGWPVRQAVWGRAKKLSKTHLFFQPLVGAPLLGKKDGMVPWHSVCANKRVTRIHSLGKDYDGDDRCRFCLRALNDDTADQLAREENIVPIFGSDGKVAGHRLIGSGFPKGGVGK